MSRGFDNLKQLLCSVPVLVFPQFGPGHVFILETDASLAGLESELETLRLIWVVKYFHAYPLGHHCVVYTDHMQHIHHC